MILFKRENFGITKKTKPKERSWVSSNSNTKLRHKDQLYQSKKREDAKKKKLANIGYVVLEKKRLITY